MSQMYIPLAIGTVAYYVRKHLESRTVTCPECAGTKQIKMIKGNGEEVVLDCSLCGLGFEPPRGTIQEAIWTAEPEVFICRHVEVRGGKIRYSQNGQHPWAEVQELFLDRYDADQHAAILAKELEEEEARRFLANLTRNREKMAFSASYWAKKKKELEKELERVCERLGMAAEKGKP